MNESEQNVIEILLRQKPDYFTYPAELEKKSNRKITRPTATTVCEKLTERGWLEMKEMCSPNHSRKTPHYRLNVNSDLLAKFADEYLQTLMKDDPHSWQKHAHIVFMGSNYIRSAVTLDLVRQVLASKKVSVAHTAPLQQNAGKNNTGIRRSEFIVCPVRQPDLDASQMISKAYKFGTSNTSCTPDESIIRQYYEQVEEKKIILPILSLILISPTALRYFLSDWEPLSSDHYSSKGIEEVEHIIFRLVWNTINDLAVTRDIPSNDFVSMVDVSTDSLLKIRLRYGDTIKYNASFSTERLYYGEGTDIYEVETNPENCTVDIIWEEKKELRYKAASNEPKDKSKNRT